MSCRDSIVVGWLQKIATWRNLGKIISTYAKCVSCISNHIGPGPTYFDPIGLAGRFAGWAEAGSRLWAGLVIGGDWGVDIAGFVVWVRLDTAGWPVDLNFTPDGRLVN